MPDEKNTLDSTAMYIVISNDMCKVDFEKIKRL